MASIRKRGQRYQVRWREGGLEQHRSAPDRATAQALGRRVERQLAVQGYTDLSVPPTCPALHEAIDDWEQVMAARVGPRTLSSYMDATAMLLRYAAGWPDPEPAEGRPDCSGVAVDVLRDDLLEGFYGWLVSSGRSRSTAYKRCGPVRLLWEWCWEHTVFGSWVGRAPRKLGLRRPASPPAVAPTWAEADACVERCDGWHRQLAILLRYTGMRLSSALLLEWRDVDLEGAVLTVRDAIAKGERGYTVPMSPHLVAELAGWGTREGYIVGAPEAEVRAATGDGRGHAGRDLKRAWARAKVRQEVCIGQPSHAFRKCLETGLVELGGSYNAVEALVGHRLPGTGRDYVDQAQGRGLWPAMVEAAELVPAVGTGNVERLRARGGAG